MPTKSEFRIVTSSRTTYASLKTAKVPLQQKFIVVDRGLHSWIRRILACLEAVKRRVDRLWCVL